MQFDQLKRRDFISLLGGAAAFAPLTARTQEAGRIYRLGVVVLSPRNAAWHVALFDELRRLGFVEGQNILVDEHGYGLSVGQLAEHASALAKAQVDVILCAGDAAIRAVQQATKTIPILALTDDMVGSGLVSSFSKPDGNTTGVSILAPELDGKRQEILMEAVPGVSRVATLADGNTTSMQQLQKLQEAARLRGTELLIYWITKSEEVASAIETAKSSDAMALNVLASPVLFNNRQIIQQRVATLRLPAFYQSPEVADEGGLMGYGPRMVQLFRDIMARQLIKLLQGAKPADLPIEQPTKFELAINLQTAKAIGLEIPAGLVLRADKVIE
jgi:putative tryptophan/tyrosine transport system substrate-binding protein